ncbi:helix-turn-helix domain-containing protein [Streptomyces sp. G44]|uniref:helix-turn-helix domain-containing protein n=1 Tax=Streptomyces sp. G44 TaxID=2807632 RepID=UPI0019600512|nr:helix-turn-helix domain-containing protein [Streptomyces sp. G44]MBM7172111.1 helix-turn-helix domain-containing protein [Streptomyces sp. G44]
MNPTPAPAGAPKRDTVAETRAADGRGDPDGSDRPARPAHDHTLGFLRVSTFRGTAPSVVHVAAGTADGPQLLLGLHSRGEATLIRRGSHGVACGPGEIFARDGAEPVLLRESAAYELHLIRISRRALTLTDEQVRELSGRDPFADGPVASLLGTLLRQLVGTSPGRAPRTALRLAGAVAELVGLLAVEEADPGPHGRDALVRRLRAYVDAHLWDRNLTPAAVAEAQHISIRYLHKLFEGHGSTVGRWIQHRRLEEARRELARPGRADLTVSAVARRWGFASATHFSRSFRAAYGMSPSDWRDGRTKGAVGGGGNGPGR